MYVVNLGILSISFNLREPWKNRLSRGGRKHQRIKNKPRKNNDDVEWVILRSFQDVILVSLTGTFENSCNRPDGFYMKDHSREEVSLSIFFVDSLII